MNCVTCAADNVLCGVGWPGAVVVIAVSAAVAVIGWAFCRYALD